MITPGQTLNDTYAVVERINSGSGGIIYKAYHRRMKKDVAIKLIKEEIRSNCNVRMEIDILKNLKNDYLPQVIDFVEDGNDVYTVMEFIEGRNFKQLIERGRRFTENQVRKYAVQLCSAVGYLHKQTPPIIHSDIKPANIMLTPQDNICLIDFNISTIIKNGIAYSKGGSSGFAAPEQFMQIIKAPIVIDDFHEATRFLDEDETEILLEDESPSVNSFAITKNTTRAFIDTRTDIYGIGASMYYMLTERTPVSGKLDFRGVKLSGVMKNIISKAMHPNPDKRYATVSELKRDLKSAVVTEKRNKTLLVSALCAGTAVIIGAGVVLYPLLKNEESVSMTETDTSKVTENTTEIISSETEHTVSETVTETITEAVSETVTVSAEKTTSHTLNTGELRSEIIAAVNKQREKLGMSHMMYNPNAEGIAADIVSDIKNGKYADGTAWNYIKGKFDHYQFYYEKAFEISSDTKASDAAESLLKYESDNFSSDWLINDYTYIGASVYDNKDGTYIIVFVMCYNDKENIQTANITTAKATETTTASGVTVSEKTNDWNESSYTATMYVLKECYSKNKPKGDSENTRKYFKGDSINVVAYTSTNYYKLRDGSYIFKDYVSKDKPFVPEIDDEPIVIIIPEDEGTQSAAVTESVKYETRIDVLPIGFTVDISDTDFPVEGTSWQDYFWSSSDTDIVEFIPGTSTFVTKNYGQAVITFTLKSDPSKSYKVIIKVVDNETYLNGQSDLFLDMYN